MEWELVCSDFEWECGRCRKPIPAGTEFYLKGEDRARCQNCQTQKVGPPKPQFNFRMPTGPMPKLKVTPAATKNGVKTRTLTDRAVLLAIHFSGFGNNRKVREEDVEVKADKARIHVVKRLLDSPELEEIEKFDNAVKRWLDSLCFPYAESIKVVPLALVELVSEVLAEAKTWRNGLVDLFIAAYPRLRDEAVKPLGSLYNPADYMTSEQVRAEFDMTVDCFEIAAPASLKDVSAVLYKEEQQKIAAKMEETLAEVRDAMRVGLLELVSRLQASLEPDAQGKAKKLTTASLEKLTQFLQTFPYRNTGDDAALESLVNQVRAAMNGATRDKLAGNETLRDRVKKGIGDAATKLTVLTAGVRARRFRFDEEVA